MSNTIQINSAAADAAKAAADAAHSAALIVLAPSAQARMLAIADQFAAGKTLASFAEEFRSNGDCFFAAVALRMSADGLLRASDEECKGKDGLIRRFVEQISLNSRDSARMYATEVISLARRVQAEGIVSFAEIGGMSDLRAAARRKAEKQISSVGDVDRHAEAGAAVIGKDAAIAAQAAEVLTLRTEAEEANAAVEVYLRKLAQVEVDRDEARSMQAKLTATVDSLKNDRDSLALALADMTAQRDRLQGEVDALRMLQNRKAKAKTGTDK